ncbi:MAG: hypothetical protein LBF27_24350 [Sphingobacterium sp.]|nr:hypothetical protein [Sphingobacterium sp.]
MVKIRMRMIAWIFCLIHMSVMAQDNKLVFDAVFAPSEGFVNRTEKKHRKEICLNGTWEIQTMRLPKTYKQGGGQAPVLDKPTASGWSDTPIKIPSPWNVNSFANRDLQGPDHRNFPSYPKAWEEAKMAWMKKSVVVPADWTGKTIKLHFEAVSGYAEVYVNNQKVGENFDLFLPFDIDITKYAQPGKAIEVLVGVRDQALFENSATIGRRIVPAGSMWGNHIRGIWQDVYLLAVPKVHVEDLYIQPLVSQGILQVEVTVRNNSDRKEAVDLSAKVNEWINLAGKSTLLAPVPNWELGSAVVLAGRAALTVPAHSAAKMRVNIPVKAGALKHWHPDHPNLYALQVNLNHKNEEIDTKYERFGWREWTFKGTKQYLNGTAIELKGDSWHFMGIPQMTRRYAWAWFSAIKDMNGNAVRPHAQVYPRFYLDMADEMGICVLNETANWASDGGPKLDAEQFWEASKDHLRRFVLRDRNHASVFGWSISNENKPVILHVYNKPELMTSQKKAWAEWRNIVAELDPSRPWISADGEDDGDGILPTTVGHYGDVNSLKKWKAVGKPWGVGEHSMAYYGTPEQVSKYNGEQAYESQLGRMKGLAKEVYDLLSNQRAMGASYVSVFNMAWYGLKPLPIGHRNLNKIPDIKQDGVFFSAFEEGKPGVQPERIGPYSTTFNPGYDESLPGYATWPMFEAMRAANAPGKPAWSPYGTIEKEQKDKIAFVPEKTYAEVLFMGKNTAVKQVLDAQGVQFVAQIKNAAHALVIVDGTTALQQADEQRLLELKSKGTDIWIWGIEPHVLAGFDRILPHALNLEERRISSFIPVGKSWFTGLNNSDFYFCEVQQADAARYGMKGMLIDQGEVLLNGCQTDWRRWNKRAEEIKTAATYRSELEGSDAYPVFVRYRQANSTLYISTLSEFANSEKGFKTLATLLAQAGIPCQKNTESNAPQFFLRDGNLQFPNTIKDNFQQQEGVPLLEFWVWSPRPLDDLLIEPDMPKLTLTVATSKSSLFLNEKEWKGNQENRHNCLYRELPLLQGWNKLALKVNKEDLAEFKAYFNCDNKNTFLTQLKITLKDPKVK